MALAEEGEGIHLDQLLSGYKTTTDKIVVVEENDKKVTYKVKYQNDIEIERTVINEETIKQEVNSSTRNSDTIDRTSKNTNSNSTSVASSSTKGTNLASKVQGMTPKKVTLNASAYSAATCDKSPSSPTYGITANGAKATAWYTVAAGKSYPFGTIIYIPYFANKPNGGWFVVQDRGGAISDKKLDIFMNTTAECIQFGRRNLECYVYEF